MSENSMENEESWKGIEDSRICRYANILYIYDATPSSSANYSLGRMNGCAESCLLLLYLHIYISISMYESIA